MGRRIITGDWIERLRELPDESVNCCVTSPPYWGLRDYGTASWEGGDPRCDHVASERWYTEQTAAVSSAGAFSVGGEANAERLKKGRWREKGLCVKCGAARVDLQLGLERTPEEYVAKMVEGFREVRRVLRSDGTLWMNLGDSYQGGNRGEFGKTRGGNGIQASNPGSDTIAAPNRFPIPGLKAKDLVGIPWMVAFALRSDGWWLRQDIIWSKPNPMPESVTDRCTKAHEYLFLMTKSERYYCDMEAIKEQQAECSRERARYGWNGVVDDGSGGARTGSTFKRMAKTGEPIGTIPEDGMRNKRSVWEIATSPFPEAHFATFPPKLVEPCILAGCPEGGTVLDPFSGAGTTGLVATRLQRNYIGIELNPEYVAMAEKRITQDAPLFNTENFDVAQIDI